MIRGAKYRIIGINLLVALALTLMLNLSFLLIREHPGRRVDLFPGIYILVQVLYFFFVSWVMLSVNTLKRLSLMRRIGNRRLLDGKRRTDRCLELIDYIIESRRSVVAQALNIK